MRIRQIKPEFFSDADMAEIPFRARLTYVGLWCIADDSGWLPVDSTQIAHDLYGFDKRKVREGWVVLDLVELQAAGRLEVYPCGHGYIPTLERHQRMTSGVRRVEMYRKAHASQCLSADIRGIPAKSAAERNGTVIGTVGNGTVETRTRDDEETEPSEFRRHVARPA